MLYFLLPNLAKISSPEGDLNQKFDSSEGRFSKNLGATLVAGIFWACMRVGRVAYDDEEGSTGVVQEPFFLFVCFIVLKFL